MIFKTFRDKIRYDNTIAKVLNRRSFGSVRLLEDISPRVWDGTRAQKQNSILSPPKLTSQLIRSLVSAGSADGLAFGMAGAVEEARESLAGLAPRKKRIRCKSMGFHGSVRVGNYRSQFCA